MIMRTKRLVMIMVFFFCFAPLYSSQINKGNVPFHLNVRSGMVKAMAVCAIFDYNHSHKVNLKLVQVLSCTELDHTKSGSCTFTLVLLAENEDTHETNKYLVELYQRRHNPRKLTDHSLLRFEPVPRVLN
ncbi:uncharacterized protein DS421_4g111520 [Arachis hypogaea]|nr:uncharacterized protein DS421_4g111520 [Arachis hypogaea]